ncbi:MAG: phosphoserine aminotransferase [delta proteobacterium MLS_D]|jgi:phosphoserine aminotransferase|nr:MAG: phosphoserine aminotransferase [delta proteobacterium MLS_D]
MDHNPNFSSGPCSKRPGWSLSSLNDAAVGRSHRSVLGKKKLALAITESKRLLGIPDDYLLGIFPGSDTGAFEAALWSLLGPRQVTVLVWESFSEGWATDVSKQLKLDPVVLRADYGDIPDLNAVNWSTDVVFAANGTTSGVKIPDWDWIPDDRAGLSICDATSAVFAMPVDWSKVDVLTYSWQKCLGGEAAHGVLVLSPRAVERIESYDPPWPLPKIFRMKKKGSLDQSIFEGNTINTPSMICVEDYLDALAWASGIGLDGLFERSRKNLEVVQEWAAGIDWIDFLARSKDTRSCTSVCLMIVHPRFRELQEDEQRSYIKEITGSLGDASLAHDIASYKDAPPGFRFWCGPTIEMRDLRRALDELEKTCLKKITFLSDQEGYTI